MGVYGSDGNVVGLPGIALEWFTNQWYTTNYLASGGQGSSGMMLTLPFTEATAQADSGDVGNTYLYHLVERKGGIALWQIDTIYANGIDLAPFDDTTCNPYTLQGITVDATTLNLFPGYGPCLTGGLCATVVRQCTQPSNRLCFLTVSWEPPRGRYRNTVMEIAVTMADPGTDASEADQWAACLAQWTIEDDSWNADAVSVIQTGDAFPPGEHFPRNGEKAI